MKLQIFIDIVGQLKGFSEAFQTDKKMVLFLEVSLVDIFHTLIKIIVKAEVHDEICGDNVTSFKLVKIDLAKSATLIHHELVNLPTATKALLKTLLIKINKKRQFLKKFKDNLVALMKKLQEKCALSYLIYQNSSSLSHLLMVTSKIRCMAKFSRLVDKL